MFDEDKLDGDISEENMRKHEKEEKNKIEHMRYVHRTHI